MDLSDRVWKLTQQYKEGLELALSVGLSEGKSAKDLSKDVRTYLREPAKLFRKVRDLEGNLNLSKPAKLYNPGAGVYRSSYKNAIRLTGTEINMAYRSADFIRWNQLKFVVGIQVKLSDNHTIKDPKTGKPRPFIDICDKLQGKYPKTFEFKGWHPNCRCFAIPILKTDDEFYGKTKESKNEVKELPDNFKTWHQDNQERMKNAKSLPYFFER